MQPPESGCLQVFRQGEIGLCVQQTPLTPGSIAKHLNLDLQSETPSVFVRARVSVC
jgi:hypothetical protein